MRVCALALGGLAIRRLGVRGGCPGAQVGWAHSCPGAINRTRRFHEIYAVVVHVLDPSPNPTSEKNCNCHVLFIGRGGVFAILQPVCGAFSAHFRRALKKSNQLVLLVGHPRSEFRSKIKKINGFVTATFYL